VNTDAIVIGGGAAGLFCAIEAGKRGRRVIVIEHNANVGRKIIISGGGRCNFTNINTRPENFVSKNPHFVKSALARYTPQDFVELVKSRGIAYYEKKLGQLFCRDRSQAIVDMLVAECKRARVRIEPACSVSQVAVEGEGFMVTTSRGSFRAGSLVIASGGLSFPKIGASNFGYRVAKQFGLRIEPTRPSLVPMVFERSLALARLPGVSLEAEVTAGRHSFRENILFTHRGISGPAILQASNYWRPGEAMSVDLLPGRSVPRLISADRGSKKLISTLLKQHLPERFVETFGDGRLPKKAVNELSEADIETIGSAIHGWEVQFRDTEGWDKAEVTLGGVSTDELSSQTMESKKVPGLYFIGEVVDVTGWLGGYNFQWAWSSGFAAGQSV
jgi:predicted Rossmann fold flavoprotein